MPPRIRVSRVQSQTLLNSSSTSTSLLNHELRTSPCCTRHFSQSATHDTRLRKDFYSWLDGPGQVFKQPLPGSSNYLSAYDRSGRLNRLKNMDKEKADKAKQTQKAKTEGAPETDGDVVEADSAIQQKSEEQEANIAEAQPAEDTSAPKDEGLPPAKEWDLRPYPLNRAFVSQPVLSEEMRDLIYQRVVAGGQSVVQVSAQLGVSLERVAAVVRLKQIEKDWQKDGKPLARAYSRAVLAMLPTTAAPHGPEATRPHESITDIPIVSATTRQTFHPTSEARHFTRADAAAVFHAHLKPADARIPHQELILAEKLRLQGVSNYQIQEEVKEHVRRAEEKRVQKRERQREWERKNTTVYEGRRWEFMIKNVEVDAVRDERDGKGVGWRYGVPYEDRKKGQVRIPTEVPA